MTLDEIRELYIQATDYETFEVLFQHDVRDSDIIRSLGKDVCDAYYEWIYKTQK